MLYDTSAIIQLEYFLILLSVTSHWVTQNIYAHLKAKSPFYFLKGHLITHYIKNALL